jgi:hypothetical protein
MTCNTPSIIAAAQQAPSAALTFCQLRELLALCYVLAPKTLAVFCQIPDPQT